MRLSKDEKAKVRESIKHWEEDIIAKFEEGKMVLKVQELSGNLKFYWVVKENEWLYSNMTEVKMFSDDCPLCKEYMDYRTEDGDLQCIICPYYKYHGYRCDTTFDDAHFAHWETFNVQPTLANARAMIDSLKEIIK